ncbi:MAG: cupin domain-containing protein [Quadrisphaera sp.]
MPVIRPQDAVVHEIHGSRFASYVAPSRGSREVCAWQLTVPPEQPGVPHRPNREEVLLVLSGKLDVTLDSARTRMEPGDVAFVPAGSELIVEAGPGGATAWVMTTPGLEAVTADGDRIRPPWAN